MTVLSYIITTVNILKAFNFHGFAWGKLIAGFTVFAIVGTSIP